MAERLESWFPLWALLFTCLLQGTNCQGFVPAGQNVPAQNVAQRLHQQQQQLLQLQQQNQQIQQQQQPKQPQPFLSNNNPGGGAQNVPSIEAGVNQQPQQMYKHVGDQQQHLQSAIGQGQPEVPVQGLNLGKDSHISANYANNNANNDKNLVKESNVIYKNNNNIKVLDNSASIIDVNHDSLKNNLNSNLNNNNVANNDLLPQNSDGLPGNVNSRGVKNNVNAVGGEKAVTSFQAVPVINNVKKDLENSAGAFDVANVPNKNTVTDSVKAAVPAVIKTTNAHNVIYGDKVKDTPNENVKDKAENAEIAEDEEEDEDYVEDEEYEDEKTPLDKQPASNNNVVANNDNNNLPNNIVQEVHPLPQEVVHHGAAQVQQDQRTAEQEKPGSLKVVWDWSDFAVNFEQFVMPEQKIRRAPHATTGEPWPMPQYYVTKKDKVYEIDRTNFRFKLSKNRCDVIEKALERYKPYILEDAVEDMYDNFQHAQSTMFEEPGLKYETPLYMEAPQISLVNVKIRKPCSKNPSTKPFPTTKMDETYDLFVKRTGIHIWANEVWGALRGLETFSQLVHKGTNQKLYVRDTVINDYPRFSHRGIMVDSSRHFMFKETIYDILEGMSQNRMNVMHWHLVDDQSFPFYSQAYPDLSAKGAFHPLFVYMPEDIADIIEFARLRGIRVEPEFDTPGHTFSWGLSRPDLLTQCYQGDRPVDGYLGPMDPSKNETFRFLKNFFKDVMHVFKDEFIHLGGDETPMTCWQSNPEVMKFLAKLEGRTDTGNRQGNDPYYYSYDIRKVLEYYVNRLISDLKSLAAKRTNGARFVFWQEIMNNNVQLPNDTIIHVWQGGMEDVQRATSLGLNVIYSTCWYLDLIEYGTKWSKYYQCDPADTAYGFSIDETKVLGGEAALWAEYIDNENAMTTLWPRASATAERLWSSKEVKDLDSAATRLQEHRCRMLSRGLGVGQISGPDYCLRRGHRRHQVNETNNCTHCGTYNEQSRFEVEKIKVEFEQKGGRMLDCSQAVIHAGSQMTFILILFIVIAIVVTIKFTKHKIVHIRMCKNKSIMIVFVTVILLYFFCYVTSAWMQAMEFKGSFEKRVSSNLQQH